uniref:ELAVL3 protein n=1 Tax=Homo sapiens TaxID=9606 RepID=Q9H024_HUMAN|nr:ELAVL3 protein [Homo sapiens]CAC21655.1 hypothetical protein [Homo sapiens]
MWAHESIHLSTCTRECSDRYLDIKFGHQVTEKHKHHPGTRRHMPIASHRPRQEVPPQTLPQTLPHPLGPLALAPRFSAEISPGPPAVSLAPTNTGVHTQRTCIETHDTSFHLGVTVGWRQPPPPQHLRPKDTPVPGAQPPPGPRPWPTQLRERPSPEPPPPGLGLPGSKTPALPARPRVGWMGPKAQPHTPFPSTCHLPIPFRFVGFFVFPDCSGHSPRSRAPAPGFCLDIASP